MMKKIVVKLGGSSLHQIGTLQELVALSRGYREQGFKVVIVHGGGPAINAALTAKGLEWQFINGQRRTTPEMMDTIEDVLVHQVNSFVVGALQTSQIPAVGISGAEKNLLFCSQACPNLLQVGQIEDVSTAPLETLMTAKEGAIPVIAPIGIGAGGEKYNINADWAAAKIAVALQAEKLIFLTDQDGILNEHRDLVPFAHPGLIDRMIAEGTISGGMHTKVKTMLAALDAGLQQVRVLNASLASHLLNDENVGTLLSAGALIAGKDTTEWIRKTM